MELGARSIRSAGAGSGSIEVTLPAALRDLQGLTCQIALRDGLRPEIVLMPDLREARAAFGRLWSLLAGSCGIAAGDMPLGELGLALLPGQSPAPRLAWVDGLALAAAPPHARAALARCLRALALRLAARLDIAPGLAGAFAASVTQLVAGTVLDPTDQAACDIAFAALAGDGIRDRAELAEDAFGTAHWAALQPQFNRLVELYQDWTAEPARYAALTAAWQRGVALELSGD
jgi:hypothetical protein